MFYLKLFRKSTTRRSSKYIWGVDDRDTIMRESETPSPITKLRNCFYRLYSNAKGGNYNQGINISCDVQEDTLKEEVKYELRQNGIYL